MVSTAALHAACDSSNLSKTTIRWLCKRSQLIRRNETPLRYNKTMILYIHFLKFIIVFLFFTFFYYDFYSLVLNLFNISLSIVPLSTTVKGKKKTTKGDKDKQTFSFYNLIDGDHDDTEIYINKSIY